MKRLSSLAPPLIAALALLITSCSEDVTGVSDLEAEYAYSAESEALAKASGAEKGVLYNSDAETCANGAADLTDGPYGFVVMNINANGLLIITVAVKGGTPDATYDIWVNQDPGGCILSRESGSHLHPAGSAHGARCPDYRRVRKR